MLSPLSFINTFNIYTDLVKPTPTEPVSDFRVNKCYWQCITNNGYKPSAQQIQEILSGCNEYGEQIISIVKTSEWSNPVIFFFNWYMKFAEYIQVEQMFQMNHQKLSIQDNPYYKCFVETAQSMNLEINERLEESNCEMVKEIPKTDSPTQIPTRDPTTADPTEQPTDRPTMHPIDRITTKSPTPPITVTCI